MHNKFMLTFVIFSALYNWLELEDIHIEFADQPENAKLLMVFF